MIAIEDNGKNERFATAFFLIVAMTGCLAEWIFYNYPLLVHLVDAPTLALLSTVYRHSAFWLANGIYWRLSLMVAISALVWVSPARFEPDKNVAPYLIYGTLGSAALLCCHLLLRHNQSQVNYIAGNALEISGIALFLAGVTGIKRVTSFGNKNSHDFKLKNQNTKLIVTDSSINWKTEDGYVNITNPSRGICIVGGPGSGKSYTLIEPIIDQLLGKGYTGMIYDFKFPTLGRYAYNMMHKHDDKKFYFDKEQKKPIPQRQFYCINFKDIRYSHRCNPIHPDTMDNKTKSDEAAMTVMLNLRKKGAKEDFFTESAIAYFSAILWYLRKYAVKTGKNICTLPHAIMLALCDSQKVLTILAQDPEAMIGAIPLLEALNKGAMEQLAGQTASLQIPLAKLAIKEMFWVMTGNDFTLDLNNPEAPKVVVIGNDDMLKKVFAPALSLYCSVIAQNINQKGKLPSLFAVDEFPTVLIPGIDNLPNTGRSNKVCFCIAMQDYGQLDRDYGKEESRVLKAGCGNIFVGEVSDESTAKYAAEVIGKDWQKNSSYTVSKNDVTQTINEAFNEIVPVNKIMQLKTGEFVGKVAEVEKEREKEVNPKLFGSRFIVSKAGDPSHDIPKIFDVYHSLPTGELGDSKTEEELIKMVLDQNFNKIRLEIDSFIFDEFGIANIKIIMKKADEFRDIYLYIERNGLFEGVFHDANTTFTQTIKEGEDEWLELKRNGKRGGELLDDKLKRLTTEYINSSLQQYFSLHPIT